MISDSLTFDFYTVYNDNTKHKNKKKKSSNNNNNNNKMDKLNSDVRYKISYSVAIHKQ